MKIWEAGCLVLGCAMVTSPLLAQDPSAAAPVDQAQKDKMFVHKAAEGGLDEVQLGQLATQRSNNPDVKAFGQKMVDDHTMLNNNMKPIADKMGVMVPDHLNKKDQAKYDQLSALSGDAFDKAYVADMVEDHRKDLREFKHESMTAADPQLKDATTNGSEVIAGHLKMANQLAKEIGVSVPKGHPAPPPAAPAQ
jgi:putative membrane protein